VRAASGNGAVTVCNLVSGDGAVIHPPSDLERQASLSLAEYETIVYTSCIHDETLWLAVWRIAAGG
jgi:hypothetical protein